MSTDAGHRKRSEWHEHSRIITFPTSLFLVLGTVLLFFASPTVAQSKGPGPRAGHCVVEHGNTVYFLGGTPPQPSYVGFTSLQLPIPAISSTDPDTLPWKDLPDPPISIHIPNLTLTLGQPTPAPPSWTDCFATKDGRIVVVGGATQLLMYDIASQIWTGASGELSRAFKLGPGVSVNPFLHPVSIQARILADGLTALVVCTLTWNSQPSPYYLDTTTWAVTRAIGTPETTPSSGGAGGETATGWAPVPGGGPILPPSGFRHYTVAIVGQDPEKPKEHFGNGAAFMVGGYSTLITGEVKDWDTLTSIPVQQQPTKEMARFGNAGTLPKTTRGAKAFGTGPSLLTVFPGNGGRQSATDLSQVVYRVDTQARTADPVAVAGDYWPKNAIFRGATAIGQSGQILLHGGLTTLEFPGPSPPNEAFLAGSSSLAVYDSHAHTFVNDLNKYEPPKSKVLLIGLSIGGGVLVLLLIASTIWFKRRQRSRRDDEAERTAKGMILKSENELQHLDDKDLRANRVSLGTRQEEGGGGGGGPGSRGRGDSFDMRMSDEHSQILLESAPYESIAGPSIGVSNNSAPRRYYTHSWGSDASDRPRYELSAHRNAMGTAGSMDPMYAYGSETATSSIIPPYTVPSTPVETPVVRAIPTPPSTASRKVHGPQELPAVAPPSRAAPSTHFTPQQILEIRRQHSFPDMGAGFAPSGDSDDSTAWDIAPAPALETTSKTSTNNDSNIKVPVVGSVSTTSRAMAVSSPPSPPIFPQHGVPLSPPTAYSTTGLSTSTTAIGSPSSLSPFSDMTTMAGQSSTTSLQSPSQTSSLSGSPLPTTRDRHRPIDPLGVRPGNTSSPKLHHHQQQQQQQPIAHQGQQHQQQQHPPSARHPPEGRQGANVGYAATMGPAVPHPYDPEAYDNISVPIVFEPAEGWSMLSQPTEAGLAGIGGGEGLASSEVDPVSRYQSDMRSRPSASLPPAAVPMVPAITMTTTPSPQPPPLPLASRPVTRKSRSRVVI